MSSFGGGYNDQGGGDFYQNDQGGYGYSQTGAGADDGYDYGYGQTQNYGDGYGGYDQGYAAPYTIATPSAEDGSFYPVSEIAHGQTVTALGLDTSYEALCVGSSTRSFSFKNRAATLAVYSLTDNMLYSSVAGHPEASTSTIYSVNTCMFGFPHTKPTVRQTHVPPHAYRAPFGNSTVANLHHQEHIGVTDILPLDGGYVASISPAAVRIHTHGGAQVEDYDLPGALSATIHPHDGTPTHISVGALTTSSSNSKKNEVYCMDVWQGLRVVASRGFKDRMESTVGVTAMATSQDRGTIVAGCSDGFLRVLDGSLREVATVKGHKGGVSSMSVSPDGMLIATTGLSSKPKNVDSCILYAFPEPTVYVYDLRRLGRAGIAHPFAGVRGSPRHLSFLPDLLGQPSNRLLVASGQAGGGMQILTPFEAPDGKASSFLQPSLDQGESITAMTQSDDDLALGTAAGRVLLYKYAGYSTKAKPLSTAFGKKKQHSKKVPLVVPAYTPPIPPISLDAKLLLNGHEPNIRPGIDVASRAIFSTYILQANPTISSIGNKPGEAISSFGPLGNQKIIPAGRRNISKSFLGDRQPQAGDFIITIPAEDIDLLADHNPVSKRYKGKKIREPKENPNKLIYNTKLSTLTYDDGHNRSLRGSRPSGSVSADSSDVKNCPFFTLTYTVNLHSFSRASLQTSCHPGTDFRRDRHFGLLAPLMQVITMTLG